MLALDLRNDFSNARNFAEKLLKVGILAKDTHGQTLRITPPLIIQKETVDWAVNAIKSCIQKS